MTETKKQTPDPDITFGEAEFPGDEIGNIRAAAKAADVYSEVHNAVVQVYVLTTEDKLELHARDFEQGILEKRAWVAPATLGLTLLVGLLTADFTTTLGLEGEVWKAIFVVGIVVSLLWLASNLRRGYGDRLWSKFKGVEYKKNPQDPTEFLELVKREAKASAVDES